ncbi:MAG: mannose-6-phosphate isomerase, partial [Clostridium sp.]|nr:mannose-6-phosphate isomerase [Clostridium sp.]
MEVMLKLRPVFKEMIWGGDKLQTDFHYDIPSDKTGECWAVSAHQNGDCTIEGGEYDGKKLSWLWENRKELFGNASGDRFPLLVKIIDAKDDLSIQVHPDDAYAKEH